jgi:hypothetical protein
MGAFGSRGSGVPSALAFARLRACDFPRHQILLVGRLRGVRIIRCRLLFPRRKQGHDLRAGLLHVEAGPGLDGRASKGGSDDPYWNPEGLVQLAPEVVGNRGNIIDRVRTEDHPSAQAIFLRRLAHGPRHGEDAQPGMIRAPQFLGEARRGRHVAGMMWTMLDCPEASHTSPTITSLIVSLFFPATVSVCGPPALSLSSLTLHFPSAAAVVTFV